MAALAPVCSTFVPRLDSVSPSQMALTSWSGIERPVLMSAESPTGDAAERKRGPSPVGRSGFARE